MNEMEVITLARAAIWMAIEISMPVMLVGLFVGLIVALFQALTQIQEMTLAFVPKIVAIFMAIYVMLPAFSIKMTEFMRMLADQIIAGGVGS
ncbi:MAG: flagellar biosynthetic protein FliQ [Alphaproteobacteria bacterium]|nr:MAG: flagellar biosynthetic protein FliQ [Alphaproteobacteria bacterium]